MIDALSSQSVPLVIFEPGETQSFAASYPALDRYLREHYVKAGESTFDASDARPYQVFARRDRPPCSSPRAVLVAVFCVISLDTASARARP